MFKKLFLSTLLTVFVLWLAGQNAWINELHYDNTGTDVGEFIEVAIENAGSYTLSDFEVYLYNGNGGASYDIKALDAFTTGTTSNGFTLYYYDYPTNGIQNGAPDGMALVYQGTVISGQFLSYEGTFTASGGPADGMTSVDIGVAESSSTPAGESLQLSGTGNQYSDFTWEPPATETKGTLNNNQTFGTPATVARIVGSFQGWNTTDPDYVMSENANGLYELTKSLGAADHEYKVIEGDSWSDPNYPSVNQHIVLSQTENVTWKVNVTADLVTHLNPVLTGNFFSSIGGNDWDPAEMMGEMTDPDGDDVFTVKILVPSGDWECKVALNHNWDQSTGGNTAFSSNGVDTSTFTYDFPNNITSVSGPPPPSALVTFVVIDSAEGNYDGFNLKGSWDGSGNYDPSWNGGAEHTPFYDDGTNGDTLAGDHIWTCQQNLVADNGDNTWEWGVNDTEHNWIAGNWQFTVPDTTPQTQSWTVPEVPALVINEIMYNSLGDDEEWIELYNNTDSTIDLEDWKILDNDANHTPIIIPAGHSISSGDFFTVEIFTNGSFPFTPDYDGSGNFALNNGGDAVRVWNPNGILVDIVVYDDTLPWPMEPDGNGPSLSLIDVNSDNSLAASWDPSDEDDGTPGSENFPPDPFITVLDPNGGEIIEKESNYLITWSYGNWDGNIKILVYRDGEAGTEIVTNLPVSDESYLWYVTEDMEPAEDYKITISEVNSGDPTDSSDDFFTIIEPYDVPALVFTEIMYNPPESGEDSLEFIEIYNNGQDTVDMENFYFSAGIEFTFPMVEILPDSFLLVAKDSLAMQGTFGAIAWQWDAGALSNGGEEIELKDLYDNVVDYVDYDDNPPWDTLADGQGPSLTLCNPDQDNALPESWTHSVNFAAVNAAGDTIWATPGFECQLELFAAFTADTTLVVLGDSVLFTDLTSGNPTSWSWTFEGGNPGTYDGQNPPPVAYDTAGRWDVTLIVGDGMNTDSVTYEEYIWAGEAPVADFFADPTEFVAGSFTDFTNQSTGDSLTYSWTFEGGTPGSSDEENPQGIYYNIPADSLYDVTLVVTNEFGADTLTREDYIHTTPEGIGESWFNGLTVRIYPNPARETLTIVLSESVRARVQLTDLSGKEMLVQTIASGQVIHLKNLHPGMYLVRIADQKTNALVVKKLIIH